MPINDGDTDNDTNTDRINGQDRKLKDEVQHVNTVRNKVDDHYSLGKGNDETTIKESKNTTMMEGKTKSNLSEVNNESNMNLNSNNNLLVSNSNRSISGISNNNNNNRDAKYKRKKNRTIIKSKTIVSKEKDRVLNKKEVNTGLIDIEDGIDDEPTDINNKMKDYKPKSMDNINHFNSNFTHSKQQIPTLPIKSNRDMINDQLMINNTYNINIFNQPTSPLKLQKDKEIEKDKDRSRDNTEKIKDNEDNEVN